MIRTGCEAFTNVRLRALEIDAAQQQDSQQLMCCRIVRLPAQDGQAGGFCRIAPAQPIERDGVAQVLSWMLRHRHG